MPYPLATQFINDMEIKINKKISLAIIALMVIFLGILFDARHSWSQILEGNQNASSTTNEDIGTTSPAADIFDVSLFARMYLDGSPLTVITTSQESEESRSFIFANSVTKKTINMLTVENYNLQAPDYHLVHGGTHDWLAITTINEDGTGFINYEDTWYALTASGTPIKVLSYTSGGDLDVTNYESKLTTSAVVSQNDSAVAVHFAISCYPPPTSYGVPNQCVPMSKTAHYIWDAKNDVFTIDPQNSDITENEIENLYPFPSNP